MPAALAVVLAELLELVERELAVVRPKPLHAADQHTERRRVDEGRVAEIDDDFLAALSSGLRKTIRRERRDALAEVEVVALTGSDLTEEHWDAFYRFYADTGARKWGRPYLNRQFFSVLSERMADKVMPSSTSRTTYCTTVISLRV